MSTEADTCRKFVVPLLQSAGWDTEPHSIAEQRTITDGDGIKFTELADTAKEPDADHFDLLCHLALNAPLRTRRERAESLRENKKDFFTQYGPKARQILEELLEEYAEHGAAQFVLSDVLKVPPVCTHGQIGDITKLFGGADKLRSAVIILRRR